MTHLYNKSDLELIEKNMPDIVKKHKKLKFQNITVDIKEYERNMSLVKKFIRDKGLIVYGGYAQDQLLKSKGKPGIYDRYSGSDIEFYSQNYVKDIIELAKLFHEKKWGGYLGVRVREATHIGTLTLTVNGFGYVDVTYVPKHIYQKLPYISKYGMKFIHPLIKTIDFYRVFTDPLLSYFRLSEKSEFSRFKKNLEAWKLYDLIKIKKEFPKINILDNKTSKQIRDMIVTRSSSLILIGSYATEYFKHHTNDKTVLKIPFYEVLSSNYVQDVHYFRNELEKIRSGTNFISTKEYFPLFQYTDRRIEYYLEEKSGKKQLVLVIYKVKDICLPYYNLPQKKLDIGTFQLTLLFAFINYLIYTHLFTDKTLHDLYSYIIYILISTRNEYLKSNKKSVLDNTPFKEFTFDCKGKAVDFARKSTIERTNARHRRGDKGPFMYAYDPSKDGEPNYNQNVQPLTDISGLIIKKSTSLTLNQKVDPEKMHYIYD